MRVVRRSVKTLPEFCVAPSANAFEDVIVRRDARRDAVARRRRGVSSTDASSARVGVSSREGRMHRVDREFNAARPWLWVFIGVYWCTVLFTLTYWRVREVQVVGNGSTPTDASTRVDGRDGRRRRETRRRRRARESISSTRRLGARERARANAREASRLDSSRRGEKVSQSVTDSAWNRPMTTIRDA